MVSIDIINLFLKNIFLNILVNILFFKFINKKLTIKNGVIVSITSIFASLLYYIAKLTFDIVFASMVVYVFQAVVLKIITKLRISCILVGIIISMSLSYILFIMSISLEYIIQKSFHITNILINALLSLSICTMLICLIHRTKRLKNRTIIFTEK